RFTSETSRNRPTQRSVRPSEFGTLAASSSNQRQLLSECRRRKSVFILTPERSCADISWTRKRCLWVGCTCFRNSSTLVESSLGISAKLISTSEPILISSRRIFHSQTEEPDAASAKERPCNSVGAPA